MTVIHSYQAVDSSSSMQIRYAAVDPILSRLISRGPYTSFHRPMYGPEIKASQPKRDSLVRGLLSASLAEAAN